MSYYYRAAFFLYPLLNPHPVYPACVNSPDWHFLESGAPASGCIDAPDWVKKGKPSDAGCAWVANDPAGRCKKKSKDKTKASEACECACGPPGGTAAPSAAPAVHGCDWVAGDAAARCGSVAELGAEEACAATCGGGSVDSETWYTKKARKNCDAAASMPTRPAKP